MIRSASILIITFLVLSSPIDCSPECGEFSAPNDVLQTRIVNGELASPGEFPWQVSIQRQVRPRVHVDIQEISQEFPLEQEGDIRENVIWTQPFLAKILGQNSSYQEISSWPPSIPPMPTHSPSNTIPPLPTHPPNHQAPTHPPLSPLPTFPPTVGKPLPPGISQWPPSSPGKLPPYPPMPPMPTFPPSRPYPPVSSTVIPTTTKRITPMPTSPTLPTLPTSSQNPIQPPRTRPPKPPMDRGSKWQHFCGGSIIENNWILTAAHCVENFKYSYQSGTIRVVAGSVDWKDVAHQDSQVMLVDRVIVHPGWDKNLGQHDLALLHLASPVEYVKTDKVTVNRICLSRVISQEHSGMATSSGWGFLNKDHRVTPDLLRRVDLPVVDHNTCRNAFSRVVGVSQLQVCAGQAPRGNCMGDSGGPLVQKQGNRAVQIGIVSFSIPCAVPGFPDVFTRVSKFVDWISSNTGVTF